MKSFATRMLMAAALVAVVAATTGNAGQYPPQPLPERFSGADMFGRYCATCHGIGGTGDGPLAAMLRKRPANLTLLARANGGVFSAPMVLQIIDGRKPIAGHGGGDMPIWGDAFGRTAEGADATTEKLVALVKYLETIQQKP
jgi:mono/diheme cytochrome c family protein